MVILLNRAKRKVSIKEDTYSKEIFELYKYGIEEKIFWENESLNEYTYLNTVIYGSHLKELDWLDNFIEEYTPLISGKYRLDVLMLSSAFYQFNKGNFNETIELLLPHKFKNKLLEIPAKNLSIRAYYELFYKDNSFFNYLDSSLDAFYKFLKRDVVLNNSKLKANLNFIKVLKKLMQTINSNSPNLQQELLNQFLEDNKPVIAIAWLKKKIEAI